MDAVVESLVRQRARNCCEYCQLPQECSIMPFAIDHVIARQHHGRDDPDNLCWSCFYCNSYKGPNIAGIDPVTQRIVPLFHPRKDVWKRHFQWDSSVLLGRTARGRATIDVLQINHPEAVALREYLIDAGEFPLP